MRTTLNLNPTGIPAPPPNYLGPRARRRALLRTLPRVYVPLHGRKVAEHAPKHKVLGQSSRLVRAYAPQRPRERRLMVNG